MDRVRLSKLLSYVLRHRPDEFGLRLSASGWVGVEALLRALAERGHVVTSDELERVVRESDKQRFAFSEDGASIRAQQGHSVEVLLDYAPETPPAELFHGTIARYLTAIREQGLSRGARHHVHLSETRELAARVGSRRGQPIVLVIESGRMFSAGHTFLRTPNGVWLTAHVPPEFIVFAE